MKKWKYHIWLKIKKGIISTEETILLCTIYIPLNKISIFKWHFLHHRRRDQSCTGPGMCADHWRLKCWNWRGAWLSLILKVIVTSVALTLTSLACPTERTMTKNAKKGGKQVFQLYRVQGLHIINGRLQRGSFGCYMYCSNVGSSTVGYAITDLYQTSLRAFTVKEQTRLSDHSQMTLYLKRTDTGNMLGPVSCTK